MTQHWKTRMREIQDPPTKQEALRAIVQIMTHVQRWHLGSPDSEIREDGFRMYRLAELLYATHCRKGDGAR